MVVTQWCFGAVLAPEVQGQFVLQGIVKHHVEITAPVTHNKHADWSVRVINLLSGPLTVFSFGLTHSPSQHIAHTWWHTVHNAANYCCILQQYKPAFLPLSLSRVRNLICINGSFMTLGLKVPWPCLLVRGAFHLFLFPLLLVCIISVIPVLLSAAWLEGRIQDYNDLRLKFRLSYQIYWVHFAVNCTFICNRISGEIICHLKPDASLWIHLIRN